MIKRRKRYGKKRRQQQKKSVQSKVTNRRAKELRKGWLKAQGKINSKFLKSLGF